MIGATMAVATVRVSSFERAEYARDARLFRLSALILDSILLAVVLFVVNSVYGIAHLNTDQGIVLVGSPYVTAIPWPWQTLIAVLYFAVPEAMFGATPGKAWNRLKVVRLDGRPLDLRAVIIRNLLRPIDSLPLLYLLGGFFVGLTNGSQRLGDRLAGTTVVFRHRALEPGATRSSGRAARRVLAAAVGAAIIFTIAFDYFGRPPLVIEGDLNQHILVGHLDTYALGKPTWGFGTVTYPLYGRAGNQICAGRIELRWQFLGWSQSGSMECVAS